MCGARIAAPGTPGGLISKKTPDKTAVGMAAVAAAPKSPTPVPKARALIVDGKQVASAAAPSGTLVGGIPPVRISDPGMSDADKAALGNASTIDQEPNVWQQHEGSASVGSVSVGNSSTGSQPLPHPMGHMPSGTDQSMAGVSLNAIGVRSSTKTYLFIAFGALALMALGALGMWIVAGDQGEEVATADPTPGDGEAQMEVGVPSSPGEGEEVDFVSGGPVVPSEGTGMGATSMGTGTTMSQGRTNPTMDTASMGTTQAPSMTTSTMATTMTGGTGTNTTTMESPTTMETNNPTTMTGGTGGTDVPEERDIALDLYTSRVRYVISRYYAARAQSCFDRATRNNENLRGTVVVGFTIGANGQVSSSSVRRNSTGDTSLGACLANQVRTWRLPEPPGGPMQLEMPFSR